MGRAYIFRMKWNWLTFWKWFRRGSDVEQARRLFRHQREHLELQFLQAASASGKPRGLRWTAIEWEPSVEFARELDSGRLAALVGITIQFEAIEGSDMEGLPAVANPRNASAVFFFHQNRWRTIGKAVFNFNPDEALVHFQNQYQRLPSTS
ncbi:MAG: hypothetical protein ACYC3I_21125 [Gemmataceae bacterium]